MKRIVINLCLILFCCSFAQAQTFTFDDLHSWGKGESVFTKEGKNASNTLVVEKK